MCLKLHVLDIFYIDTLLLLLLLVVVVVAVVVVVVETERSSESETREMWDQHIIFVL